MTILTTTYKKSGIPLTYLDKNNTGIALVKRDRDYLICQMTRGKRRDEFTPEETLELMTSFDSSFLKNIRDYELTTFHEITAQGEGVEYLNPETALDVLQQDELAAFGAHLVSYGSYKANAGLLKNIYDDHAQKCSVPFEQINKFAYRVKDGVLAVGYADNIQNCGPGIFFESKRGRIQKHDRICLQNIIRGIMDVNRFIDATDPNYQFRNFSAKYVVKR